MGDICSWNDPAITADNSGLVLPNQPITVVYRGGQSGTTGLFYDFVAAHRSRPVRHLGGHATTIPTNVRIIELDTSPSFACHTLALNGSDQIAEHIASGQGMWSIGYDEFGYAKTYNVADGLGAERAGDLASCPTPRTSRPPSSRPTSTPTSART